MLGGYVIDRMLDKGKYSQKDALSILRSGREWNWTRNGDFKGYSGRGGASEIAKNINSEFSSSDVVSIKDLAKKIKKEL